MKNFLEKSIKSSSFGNIVIALSDFVTELTVFAFNNRIDDIKIIRKKYFLIIIVLF